MTNTIKAFATLGRLVQSFAEDEPIADENTLSLIRSVYEKRLRGKITKISNVTLDGTGNFKGEFQQYVNPRLTKRFSFVYGNNTIQFKPLNPDDIEKFSEDIEDFAGKSKRDASNFKCKIAPCGGRCLKSGETCRQTMTPEERKAHDMAVRGRGRVDTSLAKKRQAMKQQREIERQVKEQAAAGASTKQTRKPKKETSQPTDSVKTEKNTASKKVSSTASKVHIITKQEDFDDLVMHTYGKLAKEYDDWVPIYRIRREIGELVSRDKFNDWLKKMQSSDKLSLDEGSVEDSAPDKIKDSIMTRLNGIRGYAHLGDRGKEALDKSNLRKKELDKILKDRPELDPLGTASQLSKGPKIKTQADFNKVVLDAHKRIDEEFNHENLVPIADVRKALGDRVSKKEFDNYLMELQANNKVQLEGGSGASKELQDGGIQTKLSGTRVYMKKL